MILLPGAVLPAELAYGPLIATLGDDVDAVAKDLAVYASDEPPVGYSPDTEVAGAVDLAAISAGTTSRNFAVSTNCRNRAIVR